jgi:hypothetical protein
VIQFLIVPGKPGRCLRILKIRIPVEVKPAGQWAVVTSGIHAKKNQVDFYPVFGSRVSIFKA